MKKGLNKISRWEIENIFIQKWRLNYIFHTIKNYRFKNFLEFSCDTGYFTNLIASISQEVIAVDINEKAIAYARYTKTCPNVTWVVQDILDYQIEEEAFDAIALLECLTEIDEARRDELMARVYQGLRKGGLMLLGVARQWPKRKWRFDESGFFKSFRSVENILINHHFVILLKVSVISSLRYINALMNHLTITRPLYPLVMKAVNRLPERFTRNYYILARK